MATSGFDIRVRKQNNASEMPNRARKSKADHKQLGFKGFKWFRVESSFKNLNGGEYPTDLSQLLEEERGREAGTHGAFLLGKAFMWCVCMCVWEGGWLCMLGGNHQRE